MLDLLLHYLAVIKRHSISFILIILKLKTKANMNHLTSHPPTNRTCSTLHSPTERRNNMPTKLIAVKSTSKDKPTKTNHTDITTSRIADAYYSYFYIFPQSENTRVNNVPPSRGNNRVNIRSPCIRIRIIMMLFLPECVPVSTK